MVSSFIMTRYFKPKIASCIIDEGDDGDGEAEHEDNSLKCCQEEIEILDVYDSYPASENEGPSDLNDTVDVDCVEIKDEHEDLDLDEVEEVEELEEVEEVEELIEHAPDEGEVEEIDENIAEVVEEEIHEIPTRVINLVDRDDHLDQSIISIDSTASSINEMPISPSPGKLRRSTRASTRRYRQSNKTNSSSDSESEFVFIKKTKKRKGAKSSGRKSRCVNSANENSDSCDSIIKRDEKENKINDTKTLKHKDQKSSQKPDKETLTNGHKRSSSPGKKRDEANLIKEGVMTIDDFFDDSMCRKIEKKIDQIAEKAKCGLYKQKTYDRAPLRNKYFFGEGYTYGKQMDEQGPGKEKIYPKGDVDEIPKWIEKHVIKRLYDENIVKEGFINSAVVNEYFPGGCIVSHIDPIHIFDRPIISISFNSKSFLSFGCRFSFNPIRTTEPIYAVPLHRGSLLTMRGYAADNVTHCIRPQDITERRCVVILRRVFPDAPRLGDPISPDYPLKAQRHPRSHSYENTQLRCSRKRSRKTYDEEESSKKKRTRHSY